MYAILPTIIAWTDKGRRFTLARVVWTSGSAPRRVGATMLVSDCGEISGSVSGGCLEGAVIEAAKEVIETGRSRELEFGADNSPIWSVGPECGATIRVRVEPFPGSGTARDQGEIGKGLIDTLGENRRTTLVSTIEDGVSSHFLLSAQGSAAGEDKVMEVSPQTAKAGPIDLSKAVTEAVKGAVDERKTGLIRIEERDWFVHVLPEKDRMIIVGATDIAIHLVRFAAALNFETVVIDPRETFTRRQRFEPAPDRMINSWPQEVFPDLPLTDSTYAVVLTHNAKIDDPMLHILLESSVPYIGALGSRRTHERRKQRLAESGIDSDRIDRIHGPVGLDIGSATPAEIALSIMAQIIKTKNRSGG